MGLGSSFSYKNKSALGRTRTCYLLIRNQLLYPDELQGRIYDHCLSTAKRLIIKMPRPYNPLKNKDLSGTLVLKTPEYQRVRNPVLYPAELRGQYLNR